MWVVPTVSSAEAHKVYPDPTSLLPILIPEFLEKLKRGAKPAYYDPTFPYDDVLNPKKNDPLHEALKKAAQDALIPKAITMNQYKAGLKAKKDLANRILNGDEPSKIWTKPSKYTQQLARHAYNEKQREIAIKTLGDTKMAAEPMDPAASAAYRFIQKRKKTHHKR